MKPALATLVAVLALAGCATSTPIPQGTVSSTRATATPLAKGKPAPAVSPCDAAREAFLTGTPTDVTKALQALVKDKDADGTAREYAQYYLTRDAKDPQLRDTDKSLIQMACA
jgi:hypothetical protein